MVAPRNLLSKLARQNNGAEVVEWALLAGLIVMLTVGAIAAIGVNVVRDFNSIVNAFVPGGSSSQTSQGNTGSSGSSTASAGKGNNGNGNGNGNGNNGNNNGNGNGGSDNGNGKANNGK